MIRSRKWGLNRSLGAAVRGAHERERGKARTEQPARGQVAADLEGRPEESALCSTAMRSHPNGGSLSKRLWHHVRMHRPESVGRPGPEPLNQGRGAGMGGRAELSKGL